MIRMVADHADGAVKLLAEHQTGHGMRQGQAGEPDGIVGAGFQLLIDTVSATDDERRVTPLAHPLFQTLRKLQRGQVGTAFVEDDRTGKAL